VNGLRRQSRAAVASLAMLVLLATACGGLGTGVCGLLDYSTSIQDDLDALTALDPALVAQAGTPENTAALAALDTLESTVETAQAELDAASDDEVGPIVRGSFQAVLDATTQVIANVRSAIESGDADAVASAFDGVSLVSDAINAFQGVVDTLGVDCAEPSASASASAEASESLPPSVAPTPEPTPVPTPEPTATPAPTPAPTATPEETEDEESPSPTAAPTATPVPPTPTPAPTDTPTPTPSPTPAESASASASAEPSGSESPEPSPSPSGDGDDDGGGLLPWILVLGLGGTAIGAFVLWYTGRNEPPTDDLGGPDDGLPPDAGTGTFEDTQVTPPPAAPPSPPPTAPPSAG
jgi:hypothetical protein